MKLKMLIFWVITVMMADSALALEFYQMKNFSMGGTGVTQIFNGTAAYGTPAALTFNEGRTIITFGGSIDYKIDNNLVGNVGMLSRFVDSDSTTNDFQMVANTATNLDRAGQAAQRIRLMAEMQQLSNISPPLNGDAILGVRIRRFTTGTFGTLQDTGTPDPDLTNTRMTGIGSST